MTPAHAYIKTADVVGGNLWRQWPLINVDQTKEIPCDYPGPMAVPISIMGVLSREQFAVLGITDGRYRLETGRIPYRRIIIRNLNPNLPDTIDLVDWWHRMGLEIDFKFVSALPEGAEILYSAPTAGQI